MILLLFQNYYSFLSLPQVNFAFLFRSELWSDKELSWRPLFGLTGQSAEPRGLSQRLQRLSRPWRQRQRSRRGGGKGDRRGRRRLSKLSGLRKRNKKRPAVHHRTGFHIIFPSTSSLFLRAMSMSFYEIVDILIFVFFSLG